MSAPNKIRATHLERTAIIYVRQSSPAQVRDNPESRARQYALVDEAAQLGWPASKIEVIDADQGISGQVVVAARGLVHHAGDDPATVCQSSRISSLQACCEHCVASQAT